MRVEREVPRKKFNDQRSLWCLSELPNRVVKKLAVFVESVESQASRSHEEDVRKVSQIAG
jgi:hypothetical protein